MSVTTDTIGLGLIVISNVLMFNPELVQPSLDEETVIVPVISAPVLLAGVVKLMSPLPVNPSPIRGFVFVQEIVAPETLLVKRML